MVSVNGVYGVLCYEEELAKALPAIAASKDIGKVLNSLPGALRILSWFPANLDLVA